MNKDEAMHKMVDGECCQYAGFRLIFRWLHGQIVYWDGPHRGWLCASLGLSESNHWDVVPDPSKPAPEPDEPFEIWEFEDTSSGLRLKHGRIFKIAVGHDDALAIYAAGDPRFAGWAYRIHGKVVMFNGRAKYRDLNSDIFYSRWYTGCEILVPFGVVMMKESHD